MLIVLLILVIPFPTSSGYYLPALAKASKELVTMNAIVSGRTVGKTPAFLIFFGTVAFCLVLLEFELYLLEGED